MWPVFNTMLAIVPRILPMGNPAHDAPSPPMDVAMTCSFLVAVLMLLFVIERQRYAWCELVLSIGCFYMSVFAVVYGAWPAGLVLATFAAALLRGWMLRRSPHSTPRPAKTSASLLMRNRTDRFLDPPVWSENN